MPNPFLGRVEGKLVWEIKAEGISFSSADGAITRSITYTDQGSLTDLGTAGTELKSIIGKVGIGNKIRTRVAYDKVTAITGQVYGPWIYSAAAQAGIIGMNSTPLPIELLSFDAKPQDEKVLLHWITATETNNDFFTVEKSKNGTDWTLVTQVTGSGNSNSSQSYSAYDHIPYPGTSYYRLKQTDYNGRFSYSNMVPVEFLKKSIIQVFPNPAVDMLSVVFNEQVCDAVFDIYDQKGLKICSYATELLVSSGENLPVSSLPPGIYLLRVKKANNADYFFTSKFVKTER